MNYQSQDVTSTNFHGMSHSVIRAMNERFPNGWTIGKAGGAWWAWDNVGNVIGTSEDRLGCAMAAIEAHKPAWWVK